MTADDVRARFEAWHKETFGHLCRSFQLLEARWEGYRAAHADLSGEVRELVEVCQDIEPWLAKHIVGGQLANRLRAALAKFTQEKNDVLP